MDINITMKKILLLLLLATPFFADAQIANRLINTQNFLQDVNPLNVVFTVPPNDNRFYVADRNSLRFNFNQIYGIKDTVTALGDLRWKGISWQPSWSDDILGIPSVFPSNIANVDGLQAALDGKQASGNYLTSISSSNVTTALGFTPYNATNPNGYISSISSSNVTTALGFTPYNASNPSSYISRTGISAGSGISYNSSTGVITNTAPDQTVAITGGTGISVSGSYPSFVINNQKRIETYSGTTNSSGSYTVTFATPYDSAPSVHASITNQSSTNWSIRVSSVSTTGFTVNVYQRAAVTVLAVEVLLAAVTNVSGATVDVLVVEK